jgi:hypothetical protein
MPRPTHMALRIRPGNASSRPADSPQCFHPIRLKHFPVCSTTIVRRHWCDDQGVLLNELIDDLRVDEIQSARLTVFRKPGLRR